MFEAEGRLLERHGHDVFRYTLSNNAVENLGKLKLAAKTVWNRDVSSQIADIVKENQIDVVHFHNTLPLVSPGAYWAARKAGAAVVQTLHNYRLVCPGALLYKKGSVCEKCVGQSFALDAIVGKCYRNSASASAVVAGMTAFHRGMGTWKKAVDRYIAITEFAKDKFVKGGLPAEKIGVKPNFLATDPGIGTGNGGFALFVSRLDEIKGVRTVLKAWQSEVSQHLPRLIIVGDGSLAQEVQQASEASEKIEWLGWKDRDTVLNLMKDAGVLLFPSQVFEGGTPMTIVEAFAVGLPVVASDLGTMKSMIEDGKNGRLVSLGNPQAFAGATVELLGNTMEYNAIRMAAKASFDRYYSAAANYRMLTQIYSDALLERTENYH